MDRQQKQQFVEALNQGIADASVIIVTHNQGLTVAEVEKLRKKVRDCGATFKVAKNRLTKLALKGTNFEHLQDLFNGPTAICYSTDPVAAAKAVVEFNKDNEKLVILGGAVNDNRADVEQIKALAKLPSLDELRARLIAMISTPATRIASVVQAPGGQVARVINAYATKE